MCVCMYYSLQGVITISQAPPNYKDVIDPMYDSVTSPKSKTATKTNGVCNVANYAFSGHIMQPFVSRMHMHMHIYMYVLCMCCMHVY